MCEKWLINVLNSSRARRAGESILAAGFTDGECATHAVLLNAGDRATSIYLIERLCQPGYAHRAKSGDVGAGQHLGEASLLWRAVDVSAKALADLSFWKLSGDALREIILQQPSIGIKLSRNFGGIVVQMQEYLAQRLAKTPELAGLPPHTLQAVAQRLQPVEVGVGSSLYRIGETPQGLYLVESGTLELRPERPAEGSRIETAGPGELIGAAPLLTGKPAFRTAAASEDSMVWLLSVDDFHALSAQQPGLRRILARVARAPLGREDQSQASSWLAQMPMFTEAPPDALRAVAERMTLQHIPAGERVYTMGESGNALYFIENGEIELTAENASGVVEELARVGSGGHFEGVAHRADPPKALRLSELWILQRADLDDLSMRHPSIGKALTRGVATLATDEGLFGGPFPHIRVVLIWAGMNWARWPVLRPMRYRRQQIFRASSPADTLYLLEKGQCACSRSPAGGSSDGDFRRAGAVDNQPHNASAVAETDVDVWTLAKRLRHVDGALSSLAISEHMLTQRLARMEQAAPRQPRGEQDIRLAPRASCGANMPAADA